MTDRELLAAAAKAAGWKGWRSKHGYWNVTRPDGTSLVCCNHLMPFDSYTGDKLPEPTCADAIAESGWNPLTDDGDALRLAVKMQLRVSCNDESARATYGLFNSGTCGDINEPIGDDPYTATRRAIVRAAAAMAKETA
jgi:hypothetical protein